MDRSSAELLLLRDLSQILGRLGLPWYVFGAQAAIFHGAQRSTNDIDITVLDALDRKEELMGEIRAIGGEIAVDSAVDGRVLPCTMCGSALGLDIVLGFDPYERQIAERAVLFSIGEMAIPIASAEDVLS